MKMFRNIKLTKELELLLFTVGAVILLYYAFPVYYDVSHVQAQLLQQQQSSIMGIKITSPVDDQVPLGQLTISGISTDNATRDCTVYADWNNTKPFQKAVATGKGGANDYSTWQFTYTDKYHLITNGTNDLTSKLSCFDDNNGGGTANLTTYYTLDVTGIMESSSETATSAAVEEQQNNLSNTVSSSTLPPVKGDNNNNTKTAKTTTISPESIPSLPITPSPVPSTPPSIQGQEEKNKDVAKEEPEPEPQSTTSLTEDDKTENTVKQTRKIEEVQEDEKVQDQLQQMLKKAGKTGEEVRQTVGKLREDILREIKNSLK
jgi:hypothetical protein